MKKKSLLLLMFLFVIISFSYSIIACKSENPNKISSSGELIEKNEKDTEKRSVKKMGLVRKPAVAGAFYPANPSELKEMIKDFFNNAKLTKQTDKKLTGLIVPHAGYIYSGGVAAYSYKAIQNPDEIETVIILGLSHRAPLRGISVFQGTAYETPLGILTIDEEIATELIDADEGIVFSESAHAAEHSIEVQLPFIQTLFKNVKIVTALFGYPDPVATQKFVDKVVDIAKRKKLLIIASSDFSHYHDYKTAQKMDKSAIDSILKLSVKELMAKNQNKDAELCGIYPVLALLQIMEKLGAVDAKLLHSANSGDVPYGGKDQVVGYAAIAFYASGDDLKKATAYKAKTHSDDELGREEKKRLLEIAKKTIHEHVNNNKRLKINDIINPKLLTKNGAFVTIKKRGMLRGCIGNFTSDAPLYETIIEMAISASSHDPRFPPVTEGELANLELEISVLSPLRRITDVNEIEVGKHGIYIIKGFYRGVLLPQVATEYGWDRKTFLEQTCNKANLPKDAWKDKDTEILIFSAQVFSEDEM